MAYTVVAAESVVVEVNLVVDEVPSVEFRSLKMKVDAREGWNGSGSVFISLAGDVCIGGNVGAASVMLVTASDVMGGGSCVEDKVS